MTPLSSTVPGGGRHGPLPVTVLTGFLGAGKTTLLRRLLRDRTDLRIAVIVNDLSDLAVDADLVKELREGHEELVIDLHGGSLGGALRPAFLEALDRLTADRSLSATLVDVKREPDATLAEINAGSRAGIKEGWVMTIADGSNFVGNLRIVQVDVNRAVGVVELEDAETRGEVKPGQRAIARKGE